MVQKKLPKQDTKRIYSNPVQIQEWVNFVQNKAINNDNIRQEVANSWHKCVSAGVNPLSPIKPNKENIVDSATVLEQNENDKLLDIAKPYMKQLYSSIKDSGHFIVMIHVLDKIATMEIIGHKKMLAIAERRNVIPFGSCAEKYLGTTAASICLDEKRPFQALTSEHFVQDMHEWCCSSVPIFNECGKLIAAITVANVNYKVHHPLILDLAIATTKAIEAEIKFRKFHHMYYKTHYYLNSVLENIPENLLLIDHKGKIEYLNSRTASILGTQQQDCLGKSIFDDFANIHPHRCLHRNTGLTWQTSTGTTVEFIQLAKNCDRLNNDNGYIGMIKPINPVRKAGNNASYTFTEIKACSDLMKQVILRAKKVALSDFGVLICGETGTGKELIAQSIHNYSQRRNGPFVAINCAALPKDLIQSELFGFEEGTFTGAKRGGSPGKFELAQGGTIFLDEIGDMPFELQVNLLRVLQEKAVMRLGGCKQIPLDVRIISATNRDIRSDVRAGRFREDLFYRLAVAMINLPPLRERKEDIEELFSCFIEKHCATGGILANNILIAPDVWEVLLNHDWPGNVRELEHIAMVALNNLQMNSNIITIQDLPEYLVSPSQEVVQLQDPPKKETVNSLDRAEQSAIAAALEIYGGNITKAAIALGITRATLYRKLKNISSGISTDNKKGLF